MAVVGVVEAASGSVANDPNGGKRAVIVKIVLRPTKTTGTGAAGG